MGPSNLSKYIDPEVFTLLVNLMIWIDSWLLLFYITLLEPPAKQWLYDQFCQGLSGIKTVIITKS